MTIVKDVEEGIATHLCATMKTGKVEFDGYHLTQNLHERSARESGLKGALTWRPVDSPDIDVAVLQSLRSSSWSNYLTIPHFSTLVVARK